MKKKNYIFLGLFVIIFIFLLVVYVKTDIYEVVYAIDDEVYKTETVRKNSTISDIEKIEKDGYTFLGWYDEDGNYLSEDTIIDSNKVYYAKWAVIVTEDE